MKALKLVLVFVLILGGIFGAFYFTTISDGSSLSSPDNTLFEETRNQIENEWTQRGDWDESLYTKNQDLVNQLGKDFNTVPLNELNTSLAVEIVYKKIFEEWKSSACSKAVVDKYYGATSFIISKDTKANTNNNVKKISQVYAVYINAYQLAHQSIGLTPRFNGETWNSYDDYYSSMMKKMNDMLNNSIYKEHLSNISAIKNGLNEIPGKLSEGKTRFYNALAQNIVNHYSRTPWDDRNKEEFNRLRLTIQKYKSEYGNSELLNNFQEEYERGLSIEDW